MIDCPNCGKTLPPMTVNVSEVAHLLGESRWTSAKLFKRFAFPWKPSGRKRKKALLQDVLAWFKKNSATSPEDLRAMLDGRRREERERRAVA